MSGEVQIDGVEMHDDGEILTIKIVLKNSSDRSMHAYAVVRKIDYDQATKTLKLELTDRNVSTDLITGTFMLPRLTSIDPNSSATITIKLPRVVTRMAPVANEKGPAFEQLPIHEAQNIEVHIAWSDKPFYPDERPSKTGRKRHVVDQLRTWEQEIAVSRSKRVTHPPKQEEQQ